MVNFTPIPSASAVDTAQQRTTAGSEAVGKDAFLHLLVAQIKNQDPLNPADGVQFLSQLAQFSQLEQSMGIREELEGLRTQVETLTAVVAQGAAESGTDKSEGANNV